MMTLFSSGTYSYKSQMMINMLTSAHGENTSGCKLQLRDMFRDNALIGNGLLCLPCDNEGRHCERWSNVPMLAGVARCTSI